MEVGHSSCVLALPASVAPSAAPRAAPSAQPSAAPSVAATPDDLDGGGRDIGELACRRTECVVEVESVQDFSQKYNVAIRRHAICN